MLLVCLNVLEDVGDSVDMLIVAFSVAPDFSDVVSIVNDAKDKCCGPFVVTAVVELVDVWLVTDVDVSLEETPCVAEVYVDCRLLVVEGDSDIVFVSDADKLLIVLVAFSPFVDEMILGRVDLVDVAADAVNVERVETSD